MKVKRTRSKACDLCGQAASPLYRVRGEEKDWLFCCDLCWPAFRAAQGDSYQYGGTWKANKRH